MTTSPATLLPPALLGALCRRCGVAQLYVFGSALTPRFDPARSDLDVLVCLLPAPPLTQGEALLTLWSELEQLAGRRVDLLTPDQVRNPVLQAELDSTKKLLYDAARPEISA